MPRNVGFEKQNQRVGFGKKDLRTARQLANADAKYYAKLGGKSGKPGTTHRTPPEAPLEDDFDLWGMQSNTRGARGPQIASDLQIKPGSVPLTAALLAGLGLLSVASGAPVGGNPRGFSSGGDVRRSVAPACNMSEQVSFGFTPNQLDSAGDSYRRAESDSSFPPVANAANAIGQRVNASKAEVGNYVQGVNSEAQRLSAAATTEFSEQVAARHALIANFTDTLAGFTSPSEVLEVSPFLKRNVMRWQSMPFQVLTLQQRIQQVYMLI